jgi:predicted small integral membrane protein
MLRLTKIVLMVLVGLWGVFTGIGNLAGYENGHALVVAVMMREGAIPGGGPFITMSHPLLTHFGYAVIWAGKLAAGGFCLWGATKLWLARTASAEVFNATKTTALTGCGIALVMLFGGFFVAGGAYFGMWSSAGGQASHDFAAQYMVGIGMLALFVATADS